MLEDIEELVEQVDKQVERLAELKERRDANPSASSFEGLPRRNSLTV